MYNDLTAMQKIILGLDESHLVIDGRLGCKLDPTAVPALHRLAQRAEAAGFTLAVASSYRNFERQLTIWNNKARGLRPILDDDGNALPIDSLSPYEKVLAILRWSALPGASRHHWGTDIDVYDSSRMPEDYSLQLTVEETKGAGPFAEFHQWLSKELQRSDCDFYQPYAIDCGGIAPEPWHLSYAPLAREYALVLTEDVLRAQITQTDIALKEIILANLTDIYTRFVLTA